MRELAYIQKIKSLTPILGADNIEKAEVLGWEVVVKKGEFKVGDPCVYCEIDSILPDLPCFEFLRSKKFRIKTIKLKGQISQGIVFHPSILKEVDPTYVLSNLTLGRDVTDLLKITKHDPEALLDVEPDQVKKSWAANKWSYLKWKLLGIKPVKKGSFPSDVPKTDETRVQKMGSLLEEKVDQLVYITEKCEGTSATFVYRKSGNWLGKLFGQDHIFQICSRNRIVFNSRSGGAPTHDLCHIADKYSIREGMKKMNRNLAIQGECIGPKIQGNIYKLPELDFKVFLMYDLDKGIYLSLNEMVAIVTRLGLQMVPMVQHEVSVNNSVTYYVELSKGKSKINEKIMREGIVIRSMNGDFSFKSINPEYLLKQE